MTLLLLLLALIASTASAQTYLFNRAQFATGAAPNSVAVGDFNKDGKLDLAFVNKTDNTVSILLGNTDGTFQPKTDFATGTAPAAVATGDFNGDGNLDLVVANSSTGANSVSVLLGNGNGTFGAKTDFTTGSNPLSVTAGDFNGDGKLDLAAANNIRLRDQHQSPVRHGCRFQRRQQARSGGGGLRRLQSLHPARQR